MQRGGFHAESRLFAGKDLIGLLVMTASAAALKSTCVLPSCIMTGIANMTLAIARFVPVEVVECPFATPWKRTMVAVARVKTIVDMAVEAVGSVKPGTSSDKHATCKPVRAVITVGGTVVRGIVEVAIGANRSYADPY